MSKNAGFNLMPPRSNPEKDLGGHHNCRPQKIGGHNNRIKQVDMSRPSQGAVKNPAGEDKEQSKSSPEEPPVQVSTP